MESFISRVDHISDFKEWMIILEKHTDECTKEKKEPAQRLDDIRTEVTTLQTTLCVIIISLTSP